MEIDCAQHWGNHNFGSSLNKNTIVRMNSHYQKIFEQIVELLEHTRASRAKITCSFNKEPSLSKSMTGGDRAEAGK